MPGVVTGADHPACGAADRGAGRRAGPCARRGACERSWDRTDTARRRAGGTCGHRAADRADPCADHAADLSALDGAIIAGADRLPEVESTDDVREVGARKAVEPDRETWMRETVHDLFLIRYMEREPISATPAP